MLCSHITATHMLSCMARVTARSTRAAAAIRNADGPASDVSVCGLADGCSAMEMGD